MRGEGLGLAEVPHHFVERPLHEVELEVHMRALLRALGLYQLQPAEPTMGVGVQVWGDDNVFVSSLRLWAVK
jgi:hypothetical protein